MKYAVPRCVDHLADVQPLVGDADRGRHVDRRTRAVDRDRPDSPRAPARRRASRSTGRRTAAPSGPPPAPPGSSRAGSKKPVASLSGGPTSQSRRSTEIAWPDHPGPGLRGSRAVMYMCQSPPSSRTTHGSRHASPPSSVSPGPGPALSRSGRSWPTRSAARCRRRRWSRPVVNSHQASRPCTTQPVHCARSSNAAGSGQRVVEARPSRRGRRRPRARPVRCGAAGQGRRARWGRAGRRGGAGGSGRRTPSRSPRRRRPGARRSRSATETAALALAGHRPALHGDTCHQREPGDPHDR